MFKIIYHHAQQKISEIAIRNKSTVLVINPTYLNGPIVNKEGQINSTLPCNQAIIHIYMIWSLPHIDKK
jgi:hypothetical protein